MGRLHITIAVWLAAVTVFGAHVVFAEELIVLFGTDNAAPYAFIQDGKLVGGIIKDVMDAVGQELEIDVRYRNIPRKRMEGYMLTGKVHVNMIASPAWVRDSGHYDWSLPLFPELNRLVVSAENAFPIKTFDDLNGKRVGTILGYYYPGLMEKFERGEILRDDTNNLGGNFRKLHAGRIDSLISSNILIDYYLKQHAAYAQFAIAEKIVSSHEIRAMISKQSPVPFERLNAAFQRIRESGKMAEILGKYR